MRHVNDVVECDVTGGRKRRTKIEPYLGGCGARGEGQGCDWWFHGIGW